MRASTAHPIARRALRHLAPLVATTGLLAMLAMLALLGGCGYHLSGKGASLPAHIKRIGVPAFSNSTTRPELGQRVTEAVIEQLVGRGRYQVVSDTTGVDAVLTGSVTSFTARPLSLTTQAEASRASVTLRASVRFEDLVEGRVLWEQQDYAFTADYEVTGDAEDYFDTQLSAVEEVAEDFARAVVSAIVQGF